MDKEYFNLRGKRALITGGGSGIGLGIARVFVDAGAHVVITGRRERVLKEAREQLGDQCETRVNDISELDSIPGMVKDIEANIGAIDILVNNAGINMKKPMGETSDTDLKRIVDTNLLGVFSLSRTVAESMKTRRSGSIIMISSMAAVMGIEKVSAYSVSKTGVVGLMRAMASEYGAFGIRINTIAPGWIDTPMSRKAFDGDPERKQKALDRIAARRFGSPADIGSAALFLACDASAYINMVHLPVDGGGAYHF